MWQEIVAIDSKFNDRRMMEAKDLRPLYLKRRLQLLQGQPSSRKVNPECDPDQYVMRNKKYMSLRVKLLKKQFGLPSDLTSLRYIFVYSYEIHTQISVKYLNSECHKTFLTFY